VVGRRERREEERRRIVETARDRARRRSVVAAVGDARGLARGEEAARCLDRGDPGRERRVEGKARRGTPWPARGTRVGRRENVGLRRRERGDVFGEGWRCVPLLVVPKALGDLLRHAAPQLAVVALHPRVGAQRLEQRDQRAARAVLVVSHGGSRKKKSVFSPALFPIAISRAPRGRTRRSTRYARDRSPRRASVVRAGPVADRDRPTTLRRRCTAEWTHARIVSRRFFRGCARFEPHRLLPNVQNEILGRVENGADVIT